MILLKIIYFIGSETLPSTRYIRSDRPIKPNSSTTNGYKKKKSKELYSRRPRLLYIRFSAKESAGEMQISTQQIGCFRDCTLYFLIHF